MKGKGGGGGLESCQLLFGGDYDPLPTAAKEGPRDEQPKKKGTQPQNPQNARQPKEPPTDPR